jgi:predicted transcriptional regulator
MIVDKKDLEMLEQKADILKAIAHPVRLCILRGLAKTGPSNVGKMQTCLEIPQATVSQHLAKMKAVGIIRGKRKGTQVIYGLTNVSDVDKLIQSFLTN